MSAEEIFTIVLILAGIAALSALTWVFVNLARTLAATKKTVDSVNESLVPTLKHVENITASLEPAVAKIDPLVERVSLTVDAANLEIMRLDTVMEDLGEISDTLTSAVGAVDTIANAPLKLVDKVSEKLSGFLGDKSGERAQIGDGKAASKIVKAAESAEPVRKAVAGYTEVTEN